MSPVNRDFLRRQMENYQRGRKEFHRWKEGVNSIRLLTWTHTWNEFDVKAGRCTPEQVGTTTEEFTVPFELQWKGTLRRNCLPRFVGDTKILCPIREEWFANAKDRRKTAGAAGGKDRPSMRYAVQIVDMDEPQKGVQIIDLPQSIMMGERGTDRRQKGYGLLNFLLGYQPDGGPTEVIASDDDEEGATAPAPGFLAPLPAMDDFFDREWRIKMVKVDNAMRLNHAAVNGAIVPRKKETSRPLEPIFLQQVKDLHLEPRFFPGYSSDGNHVWALAAEFLAFTRGFDGEDVPAETSGPATLVEDTDEEMPTKPPAAGATTVQLQHTPSTPTVATTNATPTVATTGVPPAPAKPARNIKPKKPPVPAGFKKGSKVMVIDKFDEDAVTRLPPARWKNYTALFETAVKLADGSPGYHVRVRPDLQTDPLRAEELVEAWAGASDSDKKAGGLLFAVPEDCVVEIPPSLVSSAPVGVEE